MLQSTKGDCFPSSLSVAMMIKMNQVWLYLNVAICVEENEKKQDFEKKKLDGTL